MSELVPAGGLRILLFDTKIVNPNHYICLAIQRALTASPGVERVVKSDHHTAIADAIHHRCNLFFAVDGEELERTICGRLAAVCGAAALWVTEDPYELSRNLANADLFDLIFTNDARCVGAYGSKGRHLPLAGARPFHWLPLQQKPAAMRYDVFFAGTAWPNRVELIKQLLRTTRDASAIKLKIALPTNQHLPPFELSLAPSQTDWRMSPPDFARFANLSLSTLVLPRVFSASGNHDFAETPPPRLFEAALAGSVQLVQSRLTAAAEYFEPGEDFIYFETAKDLLDAVMALRTDHGWRNRIAGNAQDKALGMHCYEHRVSNVLAELRAMPSKSRSTPRSTRPRLLFVVHNVVENGNFGGVEVYVKQISQLLIDKYDIYFYVPSSPRSVAVLDSNGATRRTFRFAESIAVSQLSCLEREEAFSTALIQFNISLVHFHHLIGHVPSLVEIAHALGVATAMTFHDHYAICHNFLLLSDKGVYCRPDEIAPAQCDACLRQGLQAEAGSQSVRRAYWDDILAVVDALIFSTDGGRTLNGRIYPSVAAHRNTVVLPLPTASRPAGSTPARGRALSVAVLGNFTRHKGSDTVARTIAMLDSHEFVFHIFGRLDPCYSWLSAAAHFPAVHVHGTYDPANIPRELDDCDISLHLSIFPETYCLTLSECLIRGLVPIVSDIGALGERIVDGVNGLKIAPDAEGELVQALRRLAETPGLLDTLRAASSTTPVGRFDTHRDELCAVYDRLISAHILAANVGGGASHVSLARLQRPEILDWVVPMHPHDRQIPRRGLTGLLRRGVKHLRTHGVVSAVRVGSNFVARHL